MTGGGRSIVLSRRVRHNQLKHLPGQLPVCCSQRKSQEQGSPLSVCCRTPLPPMTKLNPATAPAILSLPTTSHTLCPKGVAAVWAAHHQEQLSSAELQLFKAIHSVSTDRFEMVSRISETKQSPAGPQSKSIPSCPTTRTSLRVKEWYR